MVATVPDAAPRYFLSTELRMALVFGELNKANPRPVSIKVSTIKTVGVCGFSIASKARPIAVRPIPEEAMKRGSWRSDILPASGENNVITKGWEIIISPADCGENPLIFCRYRLMRNVMEKVEEYMINAAIQE